MMSDRADQAALRVVEASTPVRWLTGAAARIGAAAQQSRALAGALATWRMISNNGPAVVLIAALTHVALLTLSQSATAYRLLLPASTAAIAALILYRRRSATASPRD